MNVVQSMITGAQKNILITGYSLSSYFSDLVDTIVQKSQSGVFVKFFVNDIEKQTGFDKLLRYKGHFLKIYNYHQEMCIRDSRYYAPASMKAINYLKPVLGLEFTATPKSTKNVIYAFDLARGAVEGLSLIHI